VWGHAAACALRQGVRALNRRLQWWRTC